MKSNKFWSIVIMLVLMLSTSFVFSSCGDGDDEDVDVPENPNGGGSSSNYDNEGWTTNASLVRSVASYYVGTWYDPEEFGYFKIAEQQGNTYGKKNAISKAIVFNQNGTGSELDYYGGSSNAYSEDFTWKVTKTMRPNRDMDYLVIKFSNGHSINVAIYNSSYNGMNYVDRSIGFVLEHAGGDDYYEYDKWCNLIRYTNGKLSW